MNRVLFDDLNESVQFIKDRLQNIPDHAIVLGTGLGTLIDRIQIKKEIHYKLIPSFIPPTVESHSGKLILGTWKDRDILFLSGRLHYYEGYSLQEVCYPLRVLGQLGVKRVWFTNASGSVNHEFNSGDLVFIRDHINFHPENPLRGIFDPRLGPRFPDMAGVYAEDELVKAQSSCTELNIPFKTAVYFGLQGPSLETPAEYRMIKILGGDIVGMSTVPEVIVAHQQNMKILAASIVSNDVHDLELNRKTSIESVLQVIQNASHKLFDVFEKILVKD